MTNRSELDLKGLRTFLGVVEHKTVRKAADILGMTPSAVSQSLASLEMQLGVELFDRETRPMRLTSAGRRLLLDGSRLLEEIERVRSRVCSETLSARALRLGWANRWRRHRVPGCWRSFVEKLPIWLFIPT